MRSDNIFTPALLFIFWLLMPGQVHSQASTNANYIQSASITKPGVTSQSQLDALTVDERLQQIDYFDGLGRLIQRNAVQGSTNKKDVITPVAYDGFGRQIKTYLPYTDVNGTVYGALHSAAFTEQSAFYDPAMSTIDIQKDKHPYTQTFMEFSPLDRVLEQGAPGETWQPGSGHTASVRYSLNTAEDAVKIWTIGYSEGSLPVSAENYVANDLYKMITTDANNKQVVEFKDREGKTILKKLQLADLPAPGASGWLCTYYVYDDFNNLRFVIPPKAVELLESGTALIALADELCFRYAYDERQRMIVKKVPGAGEQYFVYDQRDRLVFTQDANMRSSHQWLTTLYDGLNRQVMTAMITYTGTRSALQTYTDNNTGTGIQTTINSSIPPPNDVMVAERQNGKTAYTAARSISFVGEFSSEPSAEFTATIDARASTEKTIIVDNPLPAGNNLVALTYTYYDSYGWTNKQYDISSLSKLSAGANLYPETPPATIAAQKAVNSTGLVTGTKLRVIEDAARLSLGPLLTNVTYYDDKGRIIQSQADNYNNGADITTQLYDFSGKLLSSFTAHNNPNAINSTGVRTDVVYDHVGRVVTISKAIYAKSSEGNPVVSTITQRNEYDAIGQLKRKTLEPGYNGNAGLEKLNYDYNIRGWLLGINPAYARDDNNNNFFGFDLGYDKANNNLVGGQSYKSPQYNGNIAGTVWKSKGDQEKRKYDFTYDAVNRLTGADFNQYAGGAFDKSAGIDFTVSRLTYDGNGNILSMNQSGWKPGGSASIDKLVYTYQPNSNKLLNVKDGSNLPSTTLGDFNTSSLHPQASAKQSATSSAALTLITDYTYDANGNLTKDLNKDIGNASTTGIVYNYLNLPSQVTFMTAAGKKGIITYTYDAAGNKLAKTTVENPAPSNNNIASTTKTDYIQGFVYVNDQLQFFGHEEGRIRPLVTAGGTNTFVFDYFLKDHLGNVRAVITDQQQMDRYPVATLEASALTKEKSYFDIADAYVVNKPTSTSPANALDYVNDNGTNNPNSFADKTATSQKMYKLNAATNRTGYSKMLKVMAGDKVNILAKSYYRYGGAAVTNSQLTANDLVNALLAVASGGNPAVQHGATSAILGADPSLLTPLNSFSNNKPVNSGNQVKAALNYIILDERFKYVSAGFDPVNSDAAGGVKSHFLQDISIPKNGYLYLYCSNESNIDVFFDNLEVVHTRGPLLEETHYYPFGLVMAGISSKAANFGGSENKYKYNGKELQSNEFGDGSGLEMHDFGARFYDPQLGRWGVTDPKSDMYSSYSPYNYCLNNPIKYIDPFGEDVYLTIWYSADGEIGHAGIAVDNYKTMEKKDKRGNVIFDKKGNAETEQVKDGTVTYYDFWPGEGAGKKNAGEDQKGTVNKIEGLALNDIMTKDIGNGEKRAAEGVIQFTADATTTDKVHADAEKQYRDQRKNNVQYNGLSNNCSNFALGCLKSMYNLPAFFGRESINTDGNIWFLIPATNSYSVTPNFLYRHSANWIDNNPGVGKVLKSDPKKAANDFVDAVTNGRATDKTPGY